MNACTTLSPRAMVEEGRAIAPQDPQILKAAVKIYLGMGRLDEAREELAQLKKWEPGDADYFELQARVLGLKRLWSIPSPVKKPRPSSTRDARWREALIRSGLTSSGLIPSGSGC